jgi:hypothetical protein
MRRWLVSVVNGTGALSQQYGSWSTGNKNGGLNLTKISRLN